jgi:hypothetical protein
MEPPDVRTERERTAAELYKSGKSLADIAAVLGCTRWGARHLAVRGGAKMRPQGRPPVRRPK